MNKLNKDLLVICVTIFLCVSVFFGCIIHCNQKDTDEKIEGIRAGMVQEVIKIDGYGPIFVWKKSKKTNQGEKCN